MGTIHYGGSATPIHIEDRALAHLKAAFATKLRRNESFTASCGIRTINRAAEALSAGRRTLQRNR